MKVLHQQGLLDIAIQEYGDVKAAFDLTLFNEKSMTNDLEHNEVLIADKSIYTDSDIQSYYKRNEYVPATAFTEAQKQEINPEGISFWAINVDFIVS